MEPIQTKRKRGGRPAQTLKRELRITARFSRFEHSILHQNAGKAKLTISEFIRQAALTGKVIGRLTAEERQVIRQIIGMANNFNQMAKVANREGITAIRLILVANLQLLNQLLIRLRHDK